MQPRRLIGPPHGVHGDPQQVEWAKPEKEGNQQHRARHMQSTGPIGLTRGVQGGPQQDQCAKPEKEGNQQNGERDFGNVALLCRWTYLLIDFCQFSNNRSHWAPTWGRRGPSASAVGQARKIRQPTKCSEILARKNQKPKISSGDKISRG